MMALEPQPSPSRLHFIANVGSNPAELTCSSPKISRPSSVQCDPTTPLPIPPPPSHRKSPSRSPMSRRFSTPCRVGSATTSNTHKITTAKASTPTAHELSIGRSRQWVPTSTPVDSLCSRSAVHFGLSTVTPQMTTTTSSTSLSSDSVLSSVQSSNINLSMLTPFSSCNKMDKKCINSEQNLRYRCSESPIKLDPPPSRKSKSQSPSRSKNVAFNNSGNGIHAPVFVSRSAPSKKNKEIGNAHTKLHIKSPKLLNGFASTPQTPTVTITPTSSPPKHMFENSFVDFSLFDGQMYDASCRNFTATEPSEEQQKSPTCMVGHGTQFALSLGSDVSIFQSNKHRAENIPIPHLPPPPNKSHLIVAKLVDIDESKNSVDERNSAQSIQAACFSEDGLQLPDLPDLVYSGASSSEGTNSPYKISSSPLEEIEHRLYPGSPKHFNLINPSDLSAEELREFAMKWGSPHHAPSSHTMLLAIPPPSNARPRVTSLPAPPREEIVDDDDNEEYYRLRHFSIIGRGIVNRGDSIKTRRSKSNTCALESFKISQLETTAEDIQQVNMLSPSAPPCITLSCDDVSKMHCLDGLIKEMNEAGGRNKKWRGAWSNPGSLTTSAASSVASSRASSASEGSFPFRVVVLGGAGVGKTSICHQFMTSEHINAYDNSLDDEFGEKCISVLLDGEESEIQFVDHPAEEMSVENYLTTYEPHAIVVVFSVIDECSFLRAEEILQYLWRLDMCKKKGVILVANKTDLVRNRCIHTKEASQLAASYDCKFIETSSALDHRVDELLVGILKQIRLKVRTTATSSKDGNKKRVGRKKFRGRKTSASVKVRSFLTKVCGKEPKSKSCENLLVL